MNVQNAQDNDVDLCSLNFCIVHADSTPTLAELLHFRAGDCHINIPREVGILGHSFSLKALDTSDRWRENSMKMQRESTVRFFKSGWMAKERDQHHGVRW